MKNMYLVLMIFIKRNVFEVPARTTDTNIRKQLKMVYMNCVFDFSSFWKKFVVTYFEQKFALFINGLTAIVLPEHSTSRGM